ncbi:MAG: ABC transporter ATP-binding protein, partial [Alphaproteobacteria bacterium]
ILHLYELVTRYKLYAILLFIIALCYGVSYVLVSYQVKEIIDKIIKEPDVDSMGIVMMLIAYKSSSYILSLVAKLIDVHYKPLILSHVLKKSYAQIMLYPINWFDQNVASKIITKINYLQDSIISLITNSYYALASLSIILTSLLFLTQINHDAAIILSIFIGIYSPILFFLLKRQSIIGDKLIYIKTDSEVALSDSISNIANIKNIGAINTELVHNISPSIKRWANWDKKIRKYTACYVDLSNNIAVTLMLLAQIATATVLYKHGKMTPGIFSFIAFVSLSVAQELEKLLNIAMSSIAPKFNIAASCYDFIYSMSQTNISLKNTATVNFKGDIIFDKVSFNYNDSSTALNNISIKIKTGERIGITGVSGSGKTTLINCLLKQLKVSSGEIRIDGINISQIDQEHLRSNISLIPQEVELFRRSILDNIRIAKRDASLEDVIDACNKAHIHDEIVKMPQGYHSVIGDQGFNISVGQRQRIGIARAILKNAPILILDEATSAVDPKTEKLTRFSIDEFIDKSDATTIVIAHRISTLRHLDRILVLQEGKIVEEGSHQKLLRKNGVYKHLWDTNREGFLHEDETL